MGLLGYQLVHMLGAPVCAVALANCGGKLSQEVQLILYALQQQAQQGPCSLGRPGGWGGWGGDVVEVAKWTAWKQLGDMNRMEAMRLYVRTVDEEKPDWYSDLLRLESSGLAAQPSGTQEPGADAVPSGPTASAAEPEVLRAAAEYAEPSAWTVVPQGSQQRLPLPRYEHAAAMLGGRLWVVGGNHGGRYLSDVQLLDPDTMRWQQLPTRTRSLTSDNGATPHAQSSDSTASSECLPPIAGHTATAYDDSLVILGGHSKAKDAPPSLAVRKLDLDGNVTTLGIAGPAPASRGGHSATLIGRRLFVFGGEDPRRVSLGDLWVLDLSSWTWSQPRTVGAPPSARSAHAAATYHNRYLIIFGGGTVSTCSSDLHVLDTQAAPMQWSRPQASSGLQVTPRAGHSGVVVGSVMYIIGGGNNVTGCTDMLALDLTFLLQGVVAWHSVAAIPPRHALSSEGVALVALPPPPEAALAAAADAGASAPVRSQVLLTFGGYNGKWQNAVCVMQVPEELPERGEGGAGATEEAAMAKGQERQVPPAPQPPATRNGGTEAPSAAARRQEAVEAAAAARTKVAQLSSQLERVRHDADAALREVALAKAAAADELALLRGQLASAHAALAAAQQGWEECRAAHALEREKVLRLEAEVAAQRNKLREAAEVQKEVEHLRREVKEKKNANWFG